ncbi:MAG: LON peptidase substrate-binding domain-containing protein [Bdellovibrionaceae bacterium]|nr:LON peptidase substrate-binding domain-containing protein [Pseudobdellovibrionaceae bacterium]
MDVYLFPLVNVTLFPRTTKPLNIFEARYLEMVRDAVSTKTPIALGFIEDPSAMTEVKPGQVVPYVRSVAGYGVPQILEERSNGTMLIFINGTGKCRLGPVKNSGTPYLVCEAEEIQEDLSLDPTLHSQIQSLNKILARWITTHIPDAAQRDLFLKNLSGPEEIVGAFAAYLIRDYDLQQMVLEFDSLSEKIRFIHRLAESSEITA